MFDIAQTDGEPLPDAGIASGDPGRHTLDLRAAIAAQGIALDDVDDLDGALGMSVGGRTPTQHRGDVVRAVLATAVLCDDVSSRGRQVSRCDGPMPSGA